MIISHLMICLSQNFVMILLKVLYNCVCVFFLVTLLINFIHELKQLLILAQ